MLLAVVRSHDQSELLLCVLDGDPSGDLCDRRDTLGCAGLEELLDTGQTLGDVVRGGDTTGVEGTHRQLRAGLADGLCGDDADGLADVHGLSGGQRAAVAAGRCRRRTRRSAPSGS